VAFSLKKLRMHRREEDTQSAPLGIPPDKNVVYAEWQMSVMCFQRHGTHAGTLLTPQGNPNYKRREAPPPPSRVGLVDLPNLRLEINYRGKRVQSMPWRGAGTDRGVEA
jgi:hypothetical protein